MPLSILTIDPGSKHVVRDGNVTNQYPAQFVIDRPEYADQVNALIFAALEENAFLTKTINDSQKAVKPQGAEPADSPEPPKPSKAKKRFGMF